MSNRQNRQEEYKYKQRLVLENARRVFFASIACLVLVPVMMIINKKTIQNSELAGVFTGVLVCFEVFSGMASVMSYIVLRMKDLHLGRLLYRLFWLLFELFSFIVIYADCAGGSRNTFYPVLLATLMLVPVFGLTEQMYYMVLELVYTIFMSVKFVANAHDVFNLIVLNALLFGMSRVLAGSLRERLTLKERFKEARDGSNVDTMTGLLNRQGLEKCLSATLGGCIRSRRRISVLMIDIDDLQIYNDSFGCDRGDDCIRIVSDLIKQAVLRNTDIICRLSGGRFLVYMEGGNDMEPVSLAEKARATVERKRIPQGRRASNSFVTVSVGVASCVPKSEGDFSEIYDEAEEALFEAKNRGRNVTVYDEQIYGRYKKASY